MPSRKALDRYPESYFTLMHAAQVRAVRIQTPNPRQLRRDLYNFRSSLREAATKYPDSPSVRWMKVRADRLIFSIRQSTLYVHVPGADMLNLGDFIIERSTHAKGPDSR